MDLLLDTFRLVLAGYLLALAGAAVFGMHRDLLAYPAHATYSAYRVLVMVLTLGRVRLAEDVRRVRVQQARGTRSLRRRREEWAERRAEERAIREGRPLFSESTTWASAESPGETQAPPPQPTPQPEPGGEDAPPRLY